MEDAFPLEEDFYRIEITSALSRRFKSDIVAATTGMAPVLMLEVVEHLIKIVALLEHYIEADEPRQRSIYAEYLILEDAMLQRWGRLLAPYRNQQFWDYFQLNILLSRKEIVSDEVFNHMTEGQAVSAKEMRHVLYNARTVLHSSRAILMERRAPSEEALALLSKEKGVQALGGVPAPAPIKDAEVVEEEESGGVPAPYATTHSRRRLVLYFLVRAAGIEPRSDSSIADLTRLAHFVTGERFTTLPKSNAYKFFLKLPHDYKTAKGRLTDLQAIRPLFESLGAIRALELVDAEIKNATAGS